MDLVVALNVPADHCVGVVSVTCTSSGGTVIAVLEVDASSYYVEGLHRHLSDRLAPLIAKSGGWTQRVKLTYPDGRPLPEPFDPALTLSDLVSSAAWQQAARAAAEQDDGRNTPFVRTPSRRDTRTGDLESSIRKLQEEKNLPFASVRRPSLVDAAPAQTAGPEAPHKQEASTSESDAPTSPGATLAGASAAAPSVALATAPSATPEATPETPTEFSRLKTAQPAVSASSLPLAEELPLQPDCGSTISRTPGALSMAKEKLRGALSVAIDTPQGALSVAIEKPEGAAPAAPAACGSPGSPGRPGRPRSPDSSGSPDVSLAIEKPHCGAFSVATDKTHGGTLSVATDKSHGSSAVADVASREAGGRVFMVSSLDDAHPADNVIDGNEKTYWLSTGLYPQEIILELGRPSRVAGVQLSATNVRAFRVEGCSEQPAVSFEPLATGELEACAGLLQRQELRCIEQALPTHFLRAKILSGWHDFCSVHRIVVME